MVVAQRKSMWNERCELYLNEYGAILVPAFAVVLLLLVVTLPTLVLLWFCMPSPKVVDPNNTANHVGIQDFSDEKANTKKTQ